MEPSPEEIRKIVKEVAEKWEETYHNDMTEGYTTDEVPLKSYINDAIYDALERLNIVK